MRHEIHDDEPAMVMESGVYLVMTALSLQAGRIDTNISLTECAVLSRKTGPRQGYCPSWEVHGCIAVKHKC